MNWLVFAASRGDDEKLFCGGAGEKRVVRCGAFCVVGLFFFVENPTSAKPGSVEKYQKGGKGRTNPRFKDTSMSRGVIYEIDLVATTGTTVD